MRNKLNLFLIIAAIFFFLGVFFRVFNFAQVPPSLNWDEASHGINAYLISQTLKDEWGQFMPTIFRAYGDYKLPTYIYLTAIAVKIFGLNDLSVRLVSMLAGFLAVIGIGLVSVRVFTDYKGEEKKALSVISMCILAIMPWHVFLSRVALEANLSLTFIIFSIYGLLGKRSIDKFLGWFLLGISIHTYNSARVVALIVAAIFFFIDIYKKKNTSGIWGKLVFALLLIPMLWQILSGSGLARYDKLSLWTNVDRYIVETSRNTQDFPQVVEKIVFNKYTYVLSRVVKNYISYFSPSFWYQKDDPQSQFSIPGMPMWGLTVMTLFFAGLVLMNAKQRVVAILAILICILPAALTNSPAQALRPLYLIIPLTLVSSYALVYLYSKNKIFFVLTMVIMLIESGRYFNVYFNDYSKSYSDSWQYGYKQMIEYVKKDRGDKEVIITKKLGEPHIYAAMYGLYEPEDLVEADNVRFYQSGWYWTDKIGSVYFANDWQMLEDSKDVVLESGKLVPYKDKIIVSGEKNAPKGGRKIKEITDMNGKVVFVISTYE